MGKLLEKHIEKYLKDRVKQLGGYSFKWASPAHRGVPDQIVFINKQVWLIEVKKPDGKLSELQKFVGRQIREHTPNYKVVYSKEEVDSWLIEVNPD